MLLGPNTLLLLRQVVSAETISRLVSIGPQFVWIKSRRRNEDLEEGTSQFLNRFLLVSHFDLDLRLEPGH